MGQAGPVTPPAAVASLPRAPGVYRFRDARGGVLYLGRAVNLRRRVACYWGDLGSRGHLAPMVARIAGVQALVCDSEHEAAWLERNLLERRLPRWNRTAGGEEVPVYIRLDLRPRPCTGCCPSRTPRTACAARTGAWRRLAGSGPATVPR